METQEPMRLIGARLATGPESAVRRDIAVRDGRLRSPDQSPRRAKTLDLSGHLILPGLINAHDHLEFNLFPRLGHRLYSNAAEWAADIFHPDASPVREHLTIPKPIRLAWGGLRNLLSGVTTVAHHNPYEAAIFDGNFPVRVIRRVGWAHSLDFSPDLAALYGKTPRRQPFILHAAEGIDEKAATEIVRLEQLRVLGPRTVLVHALAAGTSDIDLLRRRRCSIVWCPGSNLAMFGRTLSGDVLRSGIPIALGTDSALTFAGDLLDSIRAAYVHGITPQALYRMVTSAPAEILRLRDGRGWLREGGPADLVAVLDRGQTPAEALLDVSPRFVMIGGRVKLLVADLDAGVSLFPIRVEGRGDYFVDVDVPYLTEQARKALGPDYSLAGKRVAA
jgi:cytosine/adenosine deaminase-related metal-dependent hydrolase